MTFARLNRTAGIPLRYANRHGLITGATGTGKTVSLMRLAEQFSRQGVPVFIADVKGDIAALSRSCPVEMLDLFGEAGRHVQTSISAFGADLLARSLELTDAQAGSLEITFAVAREHGLPLASIADLRAALRHVAANREAVSAMYGQVTLASIGVVQRALLRLETQGANAYFGADQFDVAAMLEPGQESILVADRLMQSPRVYSAFLLWMLTDLYERLPEVGDMEKPRLVFFFDEAHLLFRDCPLPLLRRIEQTVRLIRSKGVGVYFVTQSPEDVPPLVREQLSNVIAHDRSLPIGTARFSTLDMNGRPVAQHLVKVDLPDCPLGALSETEKSAYQQPPMATPAKAAMSIRAPIGTDMPAATEIALYGLALVALSGVAYAVYWLSGGNFGHMVAIAVALAGVAFGFRYFLALGMAALAIAVYFG